MRLLVGGSRLGTPQQLLDAAEAIAHFAPCAWVKRKKVMWLRGRCRPAAEPKAEMKMWKESKTLQQAEIRPQ